MGWDLELSAQLQTIRGVKETRENTADTGNTSS